MPTINISDEEYKRRVQAIRNIFSRRIHDLYIKCANGEPLKDFAYNWLSLYNTIEFGNVDISSLIPSVSNTEEDDDDEDDDDI